MPRTLVFATCAAMIVGCDRRPPAAQRADSIPATAAVAATDTVYSEEWNVGQDPDDPETSVDTRFRVRVAQFSSGTFRAWLDTSRAGVSDVDRTYYAADSVQVDTLARIDRFTRACIYGSGPWKPHIAIVSDTTYQHDTHPKHVWLLDTANVRIRRVSSDSAKCFVGSPE